VNGSGKTILLSHVADALVEFAKDAYGDIVAGQQLGVAPYFRVVGHVNQHVDADHSLALLQFRSKEKSFSFVEKTGT